MTLYGSPSMTDQDGFTTVQTEDHTEPTVTSGNDEETITVYNSIQFMPTLLSMSDYPAPLLCHFRLLTLDF